MCTVCGKSSIADDDSEPILGQWFEETLSPSESKSVDVPSPSSVTGASDVDGVGSKHAHYHGSADSVCMTADKKEPDAVGLLAMFTQAKDVVIFTCRLLLMPGVSDYCH